MLKKFYIISVGAPKRLIKPVLASAAANLFQLLPFGFATLAVSIIYSYYADPSQGIDNRRLWLICCVMFIALAVLFFAEAFSYRASYRGAYETSAEGRTAFAEHLRKLPLGFLSSKDPEELGSMMMSDFTQLEGALAQIMGQLIGGVLVPIIAFTGFLFFDWKMALAMFMALPLSLLLLWAVSGLEKRISGEYVNSKVNMTNRFGEYITGMKVIKAYRLQGENFKRMQQAMYTFMKSCIRVEGGVGPFYLTAVALVKSGLALITITGVYLILGAELTVPLFVTFLLVGTRVFDPLTSALMRLSEFNRSVLSGERIMGIMNEPIMTGEQDAPKAYDVTFKNVSFGYGENLVLENVSFSLKVGSLTAIVGPSGSGKSTVLKLIARFYDPRRGSVCFGGTNAKDIDPEKLLQNISMVFQDVYLFQDTIGNNIRYGRQNATQKEIEAAAKAACCHDFITALPNGYETMVGEGGSTLSGGEKQRISIARAILKDAPIILLDEATASLDPENEADVQRAIGSLVESRTVVIVAHRLKTVVQADQIIVLDKGKIAESGVHEQLLASGGLYAKLWDLQQQTSGWIIAS